MENLQRFDAMVTGNNRPGHRASSMHVSQSTAIGGEPSNRGSSDCKHIGTQRRLVHKRAYDKKQGRDEASRQVAFNKMSNKDMAGIVMQLPGTPENEVTTGLKLLQNVTMYHDRALAYMAQASPSGAVEQRTTPTQARPRNL